MDMITSPLPTSVNIRGKEVSINWDFRASILFTKLVEEYAGEDDANRRLEFYVKALRIYFGDVNAISDVGVAMEQIFLFFGGGDGAYGASDKRQGKEEQGEKRGYNNTLLNYNYDAGAIYASFLKEYGIDLVEIQGLHWYKYKALFDGLSKDSKIMEIVHIRSVNLGKLSKEEKRYYKRLKQIYSLPRYSKEEQEEIDALNEKLLNGGVI